MSLHTTELDGILPLVNRGKVRDIYEVNATTLLFVATDRISAYDVIMENGITNKGKILTKLSEFWFFFLFNQVHNHLVLEPHSDEEEIFKHLPPQLSEPKYKDQLQGRSLLVKKMELIPLEVIVRGYVTGSAWKEYKKSKTIHGIAIEEDLQESQELPTPLFTPSTKAEQGEHDENITPEQAEKIVGKELCDRIASIALDLYTKAKDYAKTKGIIIADTKFEFGLDESGNVVLVDEVLTPDSSRFWNAEKYELGKSQESYDKQFLRDWLTSNNLNGKEGVKMDDEIVTKTKEKYVEAYEVLTGNTWKD
ncbi:phosphoribosylaminoimidazole-succinocarboxamide synthase [Candidozyma pseudohaemuli]|uniref:Phosphoribosylaminoimidazole-succinocarboxamide synthase n=1 Tax=Candidozyma pseudohaemuli TaxID=418784 RepID=A0A2P7YY80_9ASCO|nr:phosphoribosylaminoimidazole-succinocarboxamide synthase [[Candida] pseudohaemulonii]PSK40902.1 phosphoribosylaminoimidazole-succinocarboxamide synthase [[Candida] pseudohaemulonii]